MNLWEVAAELSRRLTQHLPARTPTAAARLRRPSSFQTDPHWRDLVLFYEYFHGDDGAGLGAEPPDGLDRAGRQAAPAERRVSTQTAPARARAAARRRRDADRHGGPRADGREHGAPSAEGRPRGGRLRAGRRRGEADRGRRRGGHAEPGRPGGGAARAARGLGDGAGGRGDGAGRARPGLAARAGRHDHRRRQLVLQGRRAARRRCGRRASTTWTSARAAGSGAWSAATA